MTNQMHPQVAEILQQVGRFSSALTEQMHRTNTSTFTATDAANSVEATVNGRSWLTGLHIEEGLLRLGAEVVAQRVNEAVRNAEAAATASVEAEQEQLMAVLSDIAGDLQSGLGLV